MARKEVQCRLCKWKWKPRSDNPIACPRCKRYDWAEPRPMRPKKIKGGK